MGGAILGALIRFKCSAEMNSASAKVLPPPRFCLRQNACDAPLGADGFLFWAVAERFTASIALRHAVAHACLGEDVLRLSGVLFDFAADVGHIDAENLVVGIGAGTPQFEKARWK